MIDLGKSFTGLKSELETRVSSKIKKSVYAQSLRDFLLRWFELDINSSTGKVSKKNKVVLEDIQSYLEKNDITAYSKKNPEGCSIVDIHMYGDPMGVRLRRGAFEYSGRVNVVNGLSLKAPYRPFQVDAIKALNEVILRKSDYSGILAIPTGGGKTYTATYWLLKNAIDNNNKILWIAHRHELLKQALKTFKENAYTNDSNNSPLIAKRKDFTFRLISGIHDAPRNILDSDDLIVASKDSLNSGVSRDNNKITVTSHSGLSHVFEKWLKNEEKVCYLVIDEAHHAAAKTYRNIIDFFKEKNVQIKVLGLTATPTRTAESEKGLLKKIFKDDITYSIGIHELISMGFLSKPIFKEPIKTGIDITNILSNEEIEKIKYFDIESIGEKNAKSLGENKIRNKAIVDHYLKNRKTYAQTILFALNISNALALNKLFTENGIKSDFVISGTVATGTLASTPRENEQKIERFREGEIDVLINYNILTEGIDVPKVQTIFLARPTISTILMTQMIGRGLRGEKVGGTKETFIVSFLDDWHDKIAWADPKQLIDDESQFGENKFNTQQRIFKIISIAKLEEYAILLDNTIDEKTKDRIRAIDFIDRVPVGIYSFFVEKVIKENKKSNYQFEREVNIFIYKHLYDNYTSLVDELPDLFQQNGFDGQENLTDSEIERLVDQADSLFFTGSNLSIGYNTEDVKEIIRYYAKTGLKPVFLPFEDREKYDIKSIVVEIKNDRNQFRQIIEKHWNASNIGWQAFFGFDNLKYFVNEISLAWQKYEFPELYVVSDVKPTIEMEQRDYENMDLEEIRLCDPEYYQFLRDTVFEKFKGKDGLYFCAISKPKFASAKKVYFHIDHKISRQKGGLTKVSNLQLVKRSENWIKGSK